MRGLGWSGDRIAEPARRKTAGGLIAVCLSRAGAGPGPAVRVDFLQKSRSTRIPTVHSCSHSGRGRRECKQTHFCVRAVALALPHRVHAGSPLAHVLTEPGDSPEYHSQRPRLRRLEIGGVAQVGNFHSTCPQTDSHHVRSSSGDRNHQCQGHCGATCMGPVLSLISRCFPVCL